MINRGKYFIVIFVEKYNYSKYLKLISINKKKRKSLFTFLTFFVKNAFVNHKKNVLTTIRNVIVIFF